MKNTRSLKRWPLALACLALGAALTVIHAPLSIAAAIFLIFPALLRLMDITADRADTAMGRAWRGFGVGWLFGYGYFFLGLLWLGEAYSITPGDGWKYPVLAFGFPVYLALFYGIGFAIAGAMWTSSVWRIFALGLAFFVAEWLRGTVLSGFTLMAVGEVVLFSKVVTPLVGAIGVVGANGLVPVVGCLPLVGMSLWAGRRSSWTVTAILLVMIGGGIIYLQAGRSTADGKPIADVRILQTAFTPPEKWNPDLAVRAANLASMVKLTNQPREDGSRPTHVIWPETAFALFPEMEPHVVNDVVSQLVGSPTFVAGGMRSEHTVTGVRIFNTVFTGRAGKWSSIYDKQHLIPSEEFIPWRGLFEALGIANWIIPAADYSLEWGTRSKAVAIPNAAPALLAICFEILFSGEIVAAYNDAPVKPEWMVVVSDNSWFVLTQGSDILLAQSRLRAAEMGMPLVQAANHGISALIEPDGSVREKIGLGKAGVIDAKIPGGASGTFYSENSCLVWWLILAGLASGGTMGFLPGCKGFIIGPAINA
ncbi:apolipoprotein N-acyltransferase (plasmid) [Agrobacterium rosae]|uniref:Apolipoprotein N-acyltransferase n=1 Tax=Agrobacterium rosae TaxID=1972867 RepID=A0ABU4W3K7_9HYPH|nr:MULTISPECIES: apolipoprotein N-acyltransferase [Agrobacterium]MDX8311439.1 apolipoprotein N-acyltransferase [Agrobacterium sp. rho-13.3]MDX8332364.1 apolipoprotein N-acyltransferase [Agrobacterium rosae]